MACILTKTTTGKEDFTAEPGKVVTLKLNGPSGVSAEIVHIRYDGEPIDVTPPFQFTVKSGPRHLIVLAEASKPGALLILREVCSGGAEQVIDQFHYDPQGPATGYIIRGQ
jgi:hypothetical protein